MDWRKGARPTVDGDGWAERSGPRGEERRVAEALAAWTAAGRAAAVVTVVYTWGSTYRRAGAQMVVADDGTWVGTISGGCLEGDLSHVGRQVMETGTPLLVRYDLSGDEVWGLGIGCGGGMDVLVEPYRPEGGEPSVEGDGARRLAYVEATLVSTPERFVPEDWGVPGSVALKELRRLRVVSGVQAADGSFGDGPLAGWVEAEARRRLEQRGSRSGTVIFLPDGRTLTERGGDEPDAEAHQQGRQAEGWRVFFRVVRPAPILLVLGAGDDAIPVVRMAAAAGFHVIVADPRPAYAREERLPGAAQVLLTEPAETPQFVTLGERDYILVMNHHKERDKQSLATWMEKGPGYIGMLGPRRRTKEIFEELGLAPGDERVFAPVGLDVGAETPEQVAISIVAELLAHKSGRKGGHLRDRAGSIHGHRSDAGGL